MSKHTPEAEEARRLWKRFIHNVFAKWGKMSFEDKVKWHEDKK